MSNADLIERLRYNAGRQFVTPAILYESADALSAADKRIAELEAVVREADAANEVLHVRESEALQRIAELEKYGRVQDPLADRIAELERKLAVAAEALDIATTYSMLEIDRKTIVEALAQIGGEDARS